MKTHCLFISVAVMLIISCGSAPTAKEENPGNKFAVIQGQELEQVGHERITDTSVRNIVYSPDGNYVATAGEDGFLKVWDTETNRLLLNFNQGKNILYAAWSNNGSRIVTARHESVLVSSNYDAKYGFGGPRPFIIEVWDTFSGGRVSVMESTGMYAAFSPDDKNIIAQNYEDDCLNIHNAATGALVKQSPVFKGPEKVQMGPVSVFPEMSVYYVASGPAGTDFVAASVEEKGIGFYSVKSGWKTLFINDNFSYINVEMACSSNGLLAAYNVHRTSESSINRREIILYEINTGKQTALFEIPVGTIRSVRFSPDAAQLFVDTTDMTIYVFDIASGEVIDMIDTLPLHRKMYSDYKDYTSDF